jgi:hypothetical protein
MAKDPAFLFYTSDFLLGTLLMSFEDRGKYITLLSYMHHNGRLSEDTVRILVGNTSHNLKTKFKIDIDGLWYNERLEEEILKRRRFTDSRVNNGKLGGRPAGKTETAKIKPEKEKVVELYSFETFWKLYDKPTEKISCILKWSTLAEKEKAAILEKLPAYVEATPERQFRKNPLTYLRRRIWEDEHIPEQGKKQKKLAIEILAETGNYE